MAETIRVLIVDDYAVVRAGLRALIEAEPDVVVVGEADGGETAVSQALSLQPDVIVMDLAMPHVDGLMAIQAIRQENSASRILVLTDFSEEDLMLAVMKAGVAGYLLKDTLTQSVVAAIRDIYEGKLVLHPAVAHTLLQAMQKSLPKTTSPLLTRQEQDILRQVAQGLTVQEVSYALEIEEVAIHNHVAHILQKLKLLNGERSVT